MNLDARIVGFQDRLIQVALDSMGVGSLDDVEKEIREQIATRASALSSLSARAISGEDVTAELKHERAQLYLWAWIGAKDVRKAWASAGDILAETLAAGVKAAVGGVFMGALSA